MAIKYTTQINLAKRKSILKNHSHFARKNKRNYANGIPFLNFKKASVNKVRKEKIQEIIALFLGILFIVGVVGFMIFMLYLQSITSELPSPDDPFRGKNESSVIYASNIEPGKDENEILYQVFGDENRDYIKIEDVPEHVKWAVLAAEDIDFYEHPGFDIGGIIKGLLYEVFKVGTPRGGSTITQQLIKLTSLSSERTYERKIKEIIFALQVERLYSKDQILEMYLNVSNYGSNVYGIKAAAKFYFGKEVKELTLSEAAVLVRIPQNPVYNSPTLAPNPEQGKEMALAGKAYVLEQMEKYLDKINDHIKNDDDIILQEEIDAAKSEELVYRAPTINIKAPHFVFYVQKLLTTRPYNNGEPFLLSEIQTGGYKIYTTLNTDIQKIAEEEVLNGVNTYSRPRGAFNGSVVVTKPETGDILAMVGSKDYFADSEGKFFDGKVNVADTLQSMGSTMKPIGYYKAFEMGISSPGSYLPDVKIKIGSYDPPNSNNAYKGPTVRATSRDQLRESRNAPAVIILDAIGLKTYIDTLITFGYDSIAQNPDAYGPSIILGGGDVTLIEHAQGFGVFANGGDLVRLDPITKITKYNPATGEDDLIYEKVPIREHIADQRAIYMVNHILNYKNGGPGISIDGRDHAGKTGTSDMHRDTTYAGYTPDFVVVGWNGNNDNAPMISYSWGENVTKPWVVSLTKRIAPYFPEKRPFSRPGGLISGNACSNASNQNQDSTIVCAETGGDLLIEGRVPPAYIFKKTFRVCSDQQDHLARQIDETVGKAIDVQITIYKMVSPSLQSFLDAATASMIPTEYCTIERSPNSGNPWAIFNSPVDNETISGETINFNIKAYSTQGYPTRIELYLGGTQIATSTTISYISSYNAASLEQGIYPLRARVYDNTGLFGDTSINITIGSRTNPLSTLAGPATTSVGNPTIYNWSYTGSLIVNSSQFLIYNSANQLISQVDILSGSYTWTPTAAGTYRLVIKSVTNNGVVFYSNEKYVTVN